MAGPTGVHYDTSTGVLVILSVVVVTILTGVCVLGMVAPVLN